MRPANFQRAKFASNTRTKLSQSNENPIVKSMLRVLPFVSFILASGGVAFQVFVLYPWHEELSAEFMQLEESIIRLDKSLEKISPIVEDIALSRETDKYVHEKSAMAGPKISKIIPFILKH